MGSMSKGDGGSISVKVDGIIAMIHAGTSI